MYNVAACPEDVFGRKFFKKSLFTVQKLKTPSKKSLNK